MEAVDSAGDTVEGTVSLFRIPLNGAGVPDLWMVEGMADDA